LGSAVCSSDSVFFFFFFSFKKHQVYFGFPVSGFHLLPFGTWLFLFFFFFFF